MSTVRTPAQTEIARFWFATFTATSGKPFEGITRSFSSFSQAARESADSRVYAGIHFRSACEDGLAAGRKIGQRTVALYLQPVRK